MIKKSFSAPSSSSPTPLILDFSVLASSPLLFYVLTANNLLEFLWSQRGVGAVVRYYCFTNSANSHISRSFYRPFRSPKFLRLGGKFWLINHREITIIIRDSSVSLQMGELCGINVDLLQHYGSQKVLELLEVIGEYFISNHRFKHFAWHELCVIYWIYQNGLSLWQKLICFSKFFRFG